MNFLQNNKRRNSYKKKGNQSSSSQNFLVKMNTLNTNNSSNHKIYEEKLKNFVQDIKTNKIKYNLLKVLFEYEDNFKLVYDIYQKYIKSKLELEVLNFYLKSLGNFISLIHSDEPMSELDKTLNTVNKYLRVNTYYKNKILFRTGDVGTKYYILLKGKVITLVPRKLVKTMTFDEYRNHLNMLYIFGEDYLLEKTMHSNIQSCDIAYSEIDNNDNKILRNIYTKNYSCPYEKYIKIINGDEHISIENFDDYSSDEEENNIYEKNKNTFNSNTNTNTSNDINNEEKNEKDTFSDNTNNIPNKKIIKKKKKNKYYKILKYFNDNFEFIKDDKESIDSIYSHLELINESNDKEEIEDKKENNEKNKNDSFNLIKQKLKRNLKYRKNIEEENLEEKDNEDVNDFNIGIPKELLSKDIQLNHNHKHKYDGGDLPTFFTRDKNNYKYYEEEENSKDEENDKKKNNSNKKANFHFNRVLNLRRNLFIIGYENVAVILPGMSFGEISLLTEKHKRTSTIFIDEDSQIGRLNLGEYNITIKSVRAKMRTDSINFLLRTKLFGDISYLYFLNKYWIYFQCKKIQKGEFLFKMGEQSESIFIIYDGEIKISSYIDKENIDDFINAIEYNEIKKKNYYIKRMNKNKKNNNNSNTSSIFERKQKYCLMIGKKGDILGLDDIINYKNNKYICEGEVTSDYLSYYEINKNIIFNQISNLKTIKSPLNDFFNIDKIFNIIKAKQDFMINKLKNIKMTIEQRFKFFYDDNNSSDNKKRLKKNKLNKKEENKNTKLNKNKKSLSLYSIIDKKTKMNENFISKNKNTFSSSFYNNEKVKENINLFSSHDKLNKKNISQNIKKIITSNKINASNSLKSYFANLPKTTYNTPHFKNLINLKLKKNNTNLNNIINENNDIKSNNINIKFEINNNYNSNYNNKSNKSVGDNSKINFDEIECSKKTKLNYNACKPYEFPRIDDENKFNIDNLTSLKKNKILKFLFLNDNNQKYKLFKYYSIKKNNLLNNYFKSTMKSNSFKNNFFFENDSIDKNVSRNKNIKSTNSENKKLNNQTEKNSYRTFRFNNNNNLKNDKGIDIIINNYPNSKNSLNKNIQVNISPEKKEFSPDFFKKYKKKYLMKNYYFLLNNENKKKRLKINTNLLPSIEKPKNK